MSASCLFDGLLAEVSASWLGLPDKPEENPENALRALWFAAAGLPKSVRQVADSKLPILDELGEAHLRDLIIRRARGVPLAYLTQRQSFMGIEMLAGPEAMIPRAETEIVGMAALEALRALVKERGEVQVIDVCTGSGNLALGLAFHEPKCKVIGADISSKAVALATRNAAHLRLSDRVQFRESDLFAGFGAEDFFGYFDLITCNPPYISSSSVEKMPREIVGFEPRPAFDGGPFGVTVVTRLIREARRFLKPDSWLCFEVGVGQGALMAQWLAKTPGYSQVRTCCDDRGEVRALLARTSRLDTEVD
jgi:release factor glutamine methyltransferase